MKTCHHYTFHPVKRFTSPEFLLILLVIVIPFTSFAAASASCIQADFGDASYAGGMAFDQQLGIIYVTGQVGPSSCFVGVLKQTTQGNDGNNSMKFLSKHVFAESAICQTVTLRKDQAGTPLLLSVMDEGGILTDTRPSGSQKAVQYGGMIELQFNADGSTSHFAAERGVLLHQDIVQIPRSIAVDPNVGHRVFVATMTSESSAVNEGIGAESSIPNLTPGGDLKYGNDYAMTIESLRLASSPEDTSGHSFTEASSLWKKPFGVAGDTSGVGAIVNQIIFHGDDELVVVGSTQGSGFAFGEAMDVTMAGFIAKFHPDHGQLQLSRRFQIEMESANMHTNVESICQDDQDPDSIYIVGSYQNEGESKRVPFVAKLTASSLDSIWEQTFPATSNAYALGCGVSQYSGASNGNNGSVVYVAGVVEDGGEIMGKTTSHGQDDVFVVQLSTHDGTAFWMKQIGTSGNDRLARGGGGLIVLDEIDGSGGVLLMGDTTGNLYSTSSQASEVFIVRMDSQGKTPDSFEVSGMDYSQGQEAITLTTPLRRDGSGQDKEETGSEASAGDGSGGPDSTTSSPNAGSDEGDPQTSNAGERMYFLLAIVVFIIVGGFCYMCFQRRERERVTERALVFGYLQAFDVEDIDVRHSATGGWHGTYVGKLAKGHMDFENAVENFEYSEDLDFGSGSSGSQGEDDSTSASGTLLSGYSHSSIVKDSLFVDYDTTPTYGGGSRRGSKSSFTNDHNEDDEDEDLGNETSSFVRNPRFYSDRVEEAPDRHDGFSLARLSRKGPGDSQHALDPWGKEIV
jgi:hypothetical protein